MYLFLKVDKYIVKAHSTPAQVLEAIEEVLEYLIIEVEYKFIIQDNISVIDDKLLSLNLLKSDRTYEKTIMFDNKEHIMQNTNGRVRVRVVGSDKIEFSYKKPLPQREDSPKKEIEYEVNINDASSLNNLLSILNKMGYEETTSYERYRTTYKDTQVKITIDEFPFSNILEVEGPEDNINYFINKLGFESKQHTNDACDTLFTKWRLTNNLPPTDHMRFKDYDK